MRYTRYEYKKSGSLKFLLKVVIVVILSVGGGFYISSVLFGNKDGVPKSENVNSVEKSTMNNQSSNIVVLQCGFYANKENADTLISSIQQYCYPFIAEENGNYRVIAGIFNEEEATKKIQEFQEKGIDVSKTTITLKSDSSDEQKILEICDGFLKIMSEFENADVSSVKTEEFKNWCNSISGNEQKYGEKLKIVMNYINNLPDAIDRSNNSNESYKFYQIIKG